MLVRQEEIIIQRGTYFKEPLNEPESNNRLMDVNTPPNDEELYQTTSEETYERGRR